MSAPFVVMILEFVLVVTLSACSIRQSKQTLRLHRIFWRTRSELVKARENLTLAQKEREWYKSERNKAWAELDKARGEIQDLRLKLAEADLERQRLRRGWTENKNNENWTA